MKVLAIAPHPDDELLGCGGTLSRRGADGATMGWLVVTGMNEADGWPAERVQTRTGEFEEVRQGLGIEQENIFQLDLPPAQLDSLPLSSLVQGVSGVFENFNLRKH